MRRFDICARLEVVKSATRKKNTPHTAWKPGQSGNPSGRPRAGTSWADAVRAYGKCTFDELTHLLKDKSTTARELAVIRYFLNQINDPQPGLANFLAERADGKLPTPLEVSGDPAQPIKIQVAYVNDWRNSPTDAAPGPTGRSPLVEAVQLAGGGEALAQDDAGYVAVR